MVKRVLLLAVIVLFMGMPIKAGAYTDTTKEEVYRIIRDNFTAHTAEFTINLSAETLDEIGTDTDLLEAAAALDDKNTSKDGDYLEVSVLRWQADWKYNNAGKASITVTAEYRTTAEQEKLLDDEIDRALKSLNLKEATDYEKVKAIHDYIIENASYDRSMERYTAYDALIDNLAVCQGYAAAAYRMFTDTGIESRIISGIAGDGAHIWNIVKVDGKWYNIDMTWDDPVMEDGSQLLRYDYFLKNAEAFSDHRRDSAYNTDGFTQAYPIAADNYVME
jgi:hypothetical protein